MRMIRSHPRLSRQQLITTMTTLLLDYDGVLHDAEVYLVGRRPELRAEGELFEHAERLVEALEGRQDVQIVLATNWVARLGYDRAKAYLPEELRRRVIGATYHRHAGLHRREWLLLTRYYQISTYVTRHGLRDWIALDDDDEGWPADLRDHLVHCRDARAGLGDPDAYQRLREALS